MTIQSDTVANMTFDQLETAAMIHAFQEVLEEHTAEEKMHDLVPAGSISATNQHQALIERILGGMR